MSSTSQARPGQQPAPEWINDTTKFLKPVITKCEKLTAKLEEPMNLPGSRTNLKYRSDPLMKGYGNIPCELESKIEEFSKLVEMLTAEDKGTVASERLLE